MAIAIYTRVSTQEQLESGYSLQEQEDKLKSYCKAKGYTNIKVYKDGGFSGANLHRPSLTQLISDCENHYIDLVLVYKLDRLSRSQKDTLNLIEDVFLKNDVDFTSLSENFDTTTPFGRAMIGILSVFAQLERENIKERMQLGAVARAKNGYFHGGGYAPIGYDYIDGNLIVNEYEAMQVKLIYKLYLEGKSVTFIRKYMHENYTNRYASYNNDSTVKSVLTTPLYCGIITYNKEHYQGRHEAIISKETFDEVQARSQEIYNNLKRKTPFQRTKLLAGLLWCKQCGARYYSHHINARKNAKNQKGYDYYTCYTRGHKNSKMARADNCTNKKYKVEELDKIIIDKILQLDINKDYNSTKTVINEEQAIFSRLNDIDKQIDKLIDLYQLDNIDLQLIKSKIDKLQSEKETLQLKKNTKKIPARAVADILQNAKSILYSDNIELKRDIINSLIDYIEIDNDDIIIHFNF